MTPSPESPSTVNVGETNGNEHVPKRRKLNSSSSQSQQAREVGLMRKDSSVTNASFVGSASGIHFVRSVYNAVASQPRNALDIDNGLDNNDVVPGEDDQLSRSLPNGSQNQIWHSTEVIDSNPADSRSWPSVDNLLLWTESYFDSWHPAFPYLQAPVLLQSFESITQQGQKALEDTNLSSQVTILRSILSICLADRRQVPQGDAMSPLPLFLVFESFKTAIESVQDCLCQPTSIQSLQAAVGVQLFLVSMLRHNAASRLGGMIVRMAFQLGLHRCPARFPNFSASDIEVRQRLFWSIYILDRHICQSLGHPLTIRDDDIDVCLLSEERHTNAEDCSHIVDHRLRLFTLLSRAAEIKGLIMELRNKSILHSENNNDQAIDINTKLSKWANDVEDSIEELSETEHALNKFQVVLLTVSKYEAIIAMNRPVLANPKDSSIYKSSLQICINAARTVLTASHEYLANLKRASCRRYVNNEEIMDPPLLWPPLTWAVWMSAFIILYAAKENQIPYTVATRLTSRSLELLEHFALRGSQWPEACAVAIRDLRSRFLHEQQSTLRPVTATPETQSIGSHGDRHNSFTPELRLGQTRDSDNSQNFPTQTNEQSNIHNQTMPGTLDFWGNPDMNLMLSEPFAPLTYQQSGVFEEFDIPFWMGDDYSASMLSNNF